MPEYAQGGLIEGPANTSPVFLDPRELLITRDGRVMRQERGDGWVKFVPTGEQIDTKKLLDSLNTPTTRSS